MTKIKKNKPFSKASNKYFLKRISEFNISELEARQNSLDFDEHGNIKIYARHLNGEHVKYVPKQGDKNKQYKTLKRRKTHSDFDISQLEEKYSITRLSPEVLHKNPNLPKYLNPSKNVTGLGVRPFPTNTILTNYANNVTGGLMVGIEGYFKALSLSLNNIPTFAFSGNTVYNLCDDQKKYILDCKPKQVVIAYDGDARDISGKGKTVDSKRVEGFYNSAKKYAKQFFDFCKRNDLKDITLHFCVVNPSTGHKGIDDLLNAAPTEEQKEIIESFKSLDQSNYFTFIKLNKTNFDKNLLSFFRLDHVSSFYEQHKESIGINPFKFIRGTYELSSIHTKGDLFNKVHTNKHFRLLDNPFSVELEKEKIEIDQWLGEQKNKLVSIFKANSRIAINAPTSSGKTSFIIHYAKENKLQTVITVPKKIQAKQLAKEYQITLLEGNYSQTKVTKALQSDVVVCTYDTLHHLSDIQHRTLIVDESHNLVGAFNYRAKTLRKVVAQMDKANKVILLSGTQNELMCKELDYHFIEVTRKKNPTINIHKINPTGTLFESTLSELSNLNYLDKIHFCFINDTAQLHDIKKTLIQNGTLSESEIDIISRSTIDKDECKTYSDIVKNQKISDGVKLVLCTCLIEEGINIKNKNIGSIYMVGVKDVDTIRQFIARFRLMNELNLFCVLKESSVLKKEFFVPSEVRISHSLSLSEINKKYVEKEFTRWTKELDEYELRNFEAIKPDNNYNAQYLKNLYIDGFDNVRIDLLQILFDEKMRQLHSSNAAYFYSQLEKCDGFKLVGNLGVDIDDDVVDIYKNIKQTAAQNKHDLQNEFILELLDNPSPIIRAFHLRSIKSRNDKKGNSFYDKFASELLDKSTDDDAEKIVVRFQEGFDKNLFGKIVKSFVRLKSFGATAGELSTVFLDPDRSKNITKALKALKVNAELKAMESRQYKKQINSIQRLEIKAKKKIYELTKSHLIENDNSISFKEFKAIADKVFTKIELSKKLDSVSKIQTVRLTDRQLDCLFYSLFYFEKEKYHNYTMYYVSEYLHENLQKVHIIISTFLTITIEEKALKPLETLDLLS